MLAAGRPGGPGELEQSQGVSLCLVRQGRKDPAGEVGEAPGQQSQGVRVVQRRDLELRQTGGPEGFVGLLSLCSEQPDAATAQSSGDETHRGPARLVDGMKVIDHEEQRPLLRGLVEQGQCRVKDGDPARRGTGAEPEGDLEGLPRGMRQTTELVRQRADELMESREADVRLVLVAAPADDPHSLRHRQLGGRVQERRLAHARITGEQQGGSVHPGHVQERRKLGELALPADQSGRADAHVCP